MSDFIIFDTEYASWDGFLTAPEKDKKKAEIVQIAALKVDGKTLEVLDELCLFIKPKFQAKLTPYFIELTGLTDDLLEQKGTSFEAAYFQFKNFCNNLTCYSHAWPEEDKTAYSIGDGKVIKYNLQMHHLNDELALNYKNIAPWFKIKYMALNINISNQSSGEICHILHCEENLPRGLKPHNALFDVYSILAGLRKLGFSL